MEQTITGAVEVVAIVVGIAAMPLEGQAKGPFFLSRIFWLSNILTYSWK
jgi:hypothetical protein